MLTLITHKMNSPEPDKEDQYNLGHSVITRRPDGIVEIRCADNFIYEKQHIMQNHSCLRKIAGNGKILVLSITGPYTLISSEARSYTAQGHHKDFIAAEAFLISSMAQRIIANFYLKVSRPVVPANVFQHKDKEKAEEWLRRHPVV